MEIVFSTGLVAFGCLLVYIHIKHWNNTEEVTSFGGVGVGFCLVILGIFELLCFLFLGSFQPLF